jgi:hypothetical protein
MASNVGPCSPPSDSESDQSSNLSLADDAGWVDAEPEEEDKPQIISLFSDEVFDSVPGMLLHCKHANKFDFVAIKKSLGCYPKRDSQEINANNIELIRPRLLRHHKVGEFYSIRS